MNYKVYDMKNLGDERGGLIPIERGCNAPFEVRRAFYIYDTKPGTPRGAHANRYSEFIMTVISGSCKVRLTDSREETVVELNRPNQALYIDKMIWKEMYDFSYNAVMLVVSNEMYDEHEYIRDFAEYRQMMQA